MELISVEITPLGWAVITITVFGIVYILLRKRLKSK